MNEFEADKLGYKPPISSISATTTISLKASLSKQTIQFTSQKKTNAAQSLPIAVTTGTKFIKPKPKRKSGGGIAELAPHDSDAVDSELQASWISLQRKSKLYQEMAEIDEDPHSLVDFLRKSGENLEDELVQVTDELGRTRLMKKNLVDERGLSGFVKDGEGIGGYENEPFMSDDMRMQLERERWESDARSQLDAPLSLHYNPSQEIRTLGVGHYKFSQDADERRVQMEKIKELRQETVDEREKVGVKRKEKVKGVDKRRALLVQKTREMEEKKRQRMQQKEVMLGDVDLFLESLRK